MQTTLYVLAMMIARFVVPLLLLLLFSSLVERRQVAF